jgi:hypothetical protein
MKLQRIVGLAAGLVLSASVVGQSRELVSPTEAHSNTVHSAAPVQVLGTPALLDTRAGLITGTGTGGGGADSSTLQDTSLGMGVFGFAHSTAGTFRVADDFVVPAEGWTLSAITVYAYQTGSDTNTTMNAFNFQIWDGEPGLVGSNIVFGDTTTNRYSSSLFSNIYRELESAPGATNRPIMAVTASGLAIDLPAGTYWIDWQVGGTLGSGPWAPPLTTLGQSTTGNARQFDGAAWVALTDVGPQGFPMTLAGTPNVVLGPPRPVPTNSPMFLLGLLAAVLGLAVVVMRRQ